MNISKWYIWKYYKCILLYIWGFLWVLEYLKLSEDILLLRYLIMLVMCFYIGRFLSCYIYCVLKKMNGVGKKLYCFFYLIYINGI